ncbi:hypothetical protein MMC30_006281 [Trapelia coarctata]|nr:hypothetical protein [Trapelia coarctata]
MLRRPPTLITLTPDDIATYEESRLARLARLANPQPLDISRPNTSHTNAHTSEGSAQNAGGTVDPNDELKPLPGEKARRIMGR